MKKIYVINTGTSNVKSLINAIHHLDYNPIIFNHDRNINDADSIILPGVGSFDGVMKTINNNDLISPLKVAVIEKKIPILGICVGMQIFFSESEEGTCAGLNLVNGKISKLSYNPSLNLKVPNTGFREVYFSETNPLITKTIEKEFLYFNHSYGLISKNFKHNHDFSHHNESFVASFNIDNIFGMQFHPEKSQKFGLFLLKNFIELSFKRT